MGQAIVGAARTPDGRLAIAHTGGQDNAPLRLTSCTDTSCARSRTVDTGVDVDAAGGGAMALTSDSRPVIVAEDDGNRLTCDTQVCENPYVTRPLIWNGESLKDVEVAIGPDDLPAILYRSFGNDIDHHTRFVRCTTPTCDRTTQVDIPGFAGVPVLALDSTGRPLITGTRYEHGNPFDSPEYGLLLSCRDKSCRQRDEMNLGAMGRGFGANDMIVGPGDLPQIIWAGARSSDDDNQLHRDHLPPTPLRRPVNGRGAPSRDPPPRPSDGVRMRCSQAVCQGDRWLARGPVEGLLE